MTKRNTLHIFFTFLLCTFSYQYDLAQNITGTITCSGIGVPNVVVSDGYEVTSTDENGYYALTSEKKNGYVFYSVPSGYMPKVTWRMENYCKILPPYFQTLSYASPSKAEVHNFTLDVVNNTKHFMIVGADTHLANRTNDQNQFVSGFIARVKEDVASAGTTPIYSTILGDLTWDNYWYSNSFSLGSYRSVLVNNNYPAKLFPVIGNHDNDEATPATDSTDFMAAGAWRITMGPNYYSYNIGKIHYVVLDDIFYKNLNTLSSYATGIVGDRSYDNYIQDYELEWLKKDLSYVDTSTPVIVELHIPVWRINTYYPFSPYAQLTNHNSTNSTILLSNILKNYKTVHILTGHLHYNYHSHPTTYTNIHENNVAAVCATWWWTGYLTGRHICTDGTPGGYEFFTMDGDKISWQYHSIEENGNAQFRVYDMNTVMDYYNNNDSIKAMLAHYSSRTNYGKYTSTYSNCLMLNVFNYDTDWNIEATEDGKALTVTRMPLGGEDPLHTISYDVPRFMANGSYTADFCSHTTSHMFIVKSSSATGTISIKVTDGFGDTFTKTVTRPIAFNLAMKDENESKLVGIKTAKVATNEATIYVNGSTLCIESKEATVGQIVGTDGMAKPLGIAVGHNEFGGFQRGIYLVKVNGTVQKIFIR